MPVLKLYSYIEDICKSHRLLWWGKGNPILDNPISRTHLLILSWYVKTRVSIAGQCFILFFIHIHLHVMNSHNNIPHQHNSVSSTWHHPTIKTKWISGVNCLLTKCVHLCIECFNISANTCLMMCLHR